MKYFRINIYLSFYNLLISIFNFKKLDNNVNKILKEQTNKKYNIITSQCRVSFLIILTFLKGKFPDKNEIIIQSYNLPEMVNVAIILGYKINFIDIEKQSSAMSINQIKNKINNKSCAILLTNMFNSIEHSREIKKICLTNNITLIEDNAIYFDNFNKNIKNNPSYSGSIGDVSISSFGMMKNLSGLYGGSISTDSDELNKFALNMISNFNKFPLVLYTKQIIIFFILKFFSNKFLYNYFFFRIIKQSYFGKNILLNLFYPSLKFKIKSDIPKYYFCKVPKLSKNILYHQLKNYKNRINIHNVRKENNLLYYNKLSNLYSIKTLKIKDFNFQNFLEFPIIVNNKKKLIKYLLDQGIDCRFFYYTNCNKIFQKENDFSSISSYYEDSLICLPSHHLIKSQYIIRICDLLCKYDNLEK